MKLLNVLTIVALVFFSFTLIYALWLGFIAVVGFFAKKKSYTSKTEHTFAVLICARNEEKVIGQLIHSLKKQSYPKDKYQIFVVAHNCTDNTAKLAADLGIEVFVRCGAGEYKADALKFGLDEVVKKYGDYFEYYTVFDADALADGNFLKEINAALDSTGADCAGGYYGFKNFSANTVTALCAMLYCGVMQNCLAHSALGLPVNIYGSGYAVKMKWRGLIGEISTLVDDFEFSVLLVLNGARSVAAPKALFYADMPEDLSSALSQRKRWSMGDTQCYRKYRKQMRKAVFIKGKEGISQYLDLIMNPFVSFSALGAVLLAAVAMIRGISTISIITVLACSALFYAVFFCSAFLVLKKENMNPKDNIKAILLFPFWIFLSAWFAVTTSFKKTVAWKPSKRNSEISIEDIKK